MNLWLVCKFSFAFRNISWFISKNILSKVVLIHHISMLTCQSRVSQNPFQTNKSCESYHNYISIGNFKKIYLLVFAIITERLLWKLSHCIFRTRVISWLSMAYFILLRVCRFFLFLSFFLFLLWSLLLAEVLRKVCQYFW